MAPRRAPSHEAFGDIGCLRSSTGLLENLDECNRRADMSLDFPFPSRESMLQAAQLACIVHEDWMQAWPIEVSDPKRLDEFVGLLVANKDDWELTYWFLDLVLESARFRDDLDSWEDTLVDSLVVVWNATKEAAVRERLGYWACADDTLDDAFAVTPVVRDALRRIGT